MCMYIALLVLIVSTWALTPPPPTANHNPAISSVPPGTENLNKSARHRQTKSPDNSNPLSMFNNNN